MTEEWRDIRGYEGLYQVSSEGRVFGVKRGKILSPRLNPQGYARYALCKDNEYAHFTGHRLVATAFLGEQPSDRPLVLHGPNGPTDNSVENLSWGTPSQNMLDRVRDGTDARSVTKACKNGHWYTEEITYIAPNDGSRSCKICRRDAVRRQQTKRKMERKIGNSSSK